MGVGEAFAQLWPIVATLGGGYVGLILYIRKLHEDRIKSLETQIAEAKADRDAQVTQLRIERDSFRDYFLRSLQAAERMGEVAEVTRKSPPGG